MMKNYYKIENGNLITAVSKIPMQGFVEYRIGQEPQELTNALNVEKSQNEKQTRIAELKQLLRETDYVALSDYDQDKPEIIAKRAEWRAEIRALEND